MSSSVQYKAYQSKRHSRSHSGANGEPLSPSSRASISPNNGEKRDYFGTPPDSPLPMGNRPRPMSLLSVSSLPAETKEVYNELPKETYADRPKEPLEEPIIEAPMAPLPESQPTAALKPAREAIAPAPPTPTRNSSAASTSKLTVIKPQSSTFRHMPLRASSNLRPVSAGAPMRTFSSSSNPTTSSSHNGLPFLNGPRMPSSLVMTAPTTLNNLPSGPGSPAPSIGISSEVVTPHSEASPMKSSSVSPSPTTYVTRPSPLPTPRFSPLPSPSIPSVLPTPPPSEVLRRPAPYRPGFQPNGKYRHRTDEFIAARDKRRESGKVEERRLERRLEKLIDLHFSPHGAVANKPPALRRVSSIFDMSLTDLTSKNPADLLRDVLESRASQAGKVDIRAAEQAITPWQEDSAASNCPLCQTSFHPLTNRKHHCRMCGQVICSLPAQAPNRPQTCSLLFIADSRTGKIEEIGEVVDYGVRRRTSSFSQAGRGSKKSQQDEVYLRGVRICRTCRAVVLKKQYAKDAASMPLFGRLYESLMLLEKEIEDSLPEFQELVLSLTSPESSGHRKATSTRKRLLDAFSEYDALAKRIHNLPCAPGSSQERVQIAVMVKANTFLQKNMFPLQALPKPQKPTPAAPDGTPQHVIDSDSAMAHQLQPLLEQEALLEGFVEEANAQRKFEDAKALKANLKEIRVEISRIMG